MFTCTDQHIMRRLLIHTKYILNQRLATTLLILNQKKVRLSIIILHNTSWRPSWFSYAIRNLNLCLRFTFYSLYWLNINKIIDLVIVGHIIYGSSWFVPIWILNSLRKHFLFLCLFRLIFLLHLYFFLLLFLSLFSFTFVFEILYRFLNNSLNH